MESGDKTAGNPSIAALRPPGGNTQSAGRVTDIWRRKTQAAAWPIKEL